MSKWSQLRNKLESAAFLVSKEGAAKEAHSEVVQCLILLSELESSCLGPVKASPSINALHKKEEYSNEDIHKEINKVSNRLKLWAKRPNQINSKILNAFLRLERSGVSVITEKDLKGKVPEIKSFESNFSQMKIIAEKNHGKLFEQYGERITLWQPSASEVRNYEKMVFGDIELYKHKESHS